MLKLKRCKVTQMIKDGYEKTNKRNAMSKKKDNAYKRKFCPANEQGATTTAKKTKEKQMTNEKANELRLIANEVMCELYTSGEREQLDMLRRYAVRAVEEIDKAKAKENKNVQAGI